MRVWMAEIPVAVHRRQAAAQMMKLAENPALADAWTRAMTNMR